MATLTPNPTLDSTLRQPRQQYGFGPAAPSQDLPFPTHANMTAAELLTFLPHSIRSPDIIYRLVANGGTRRLFSVMINTQRLLLVRWSDNTCGTTMYKAMNEAGFEGWTVKIHSNWHNTKKVTWNEENLDVSGYRRPGQISGGQPAAPDVPFKSLAVDVRQMPRGHDALDLTRMVQYCVRKPHEVWLYPRDYNALLEHLGGPTVVAPQHHDRQVFKRWLEVELPMANSTLALLGGQTGKKRKQFMIAQDGTSAPANQLRQMTPALEKQPNKNGKSRGRPRKHGETKREGDEDVDRDPGSVDEPYTRPAAKYIAPPKKADESPHSAIELAFRVEGMVEEGDAFSPYAFGGPRTTPPHRSLHHINQPSREDISGWAENLRWASEQRRCFWQTAQAGTWNESPEHMELVAKIRKEQMWASEELVERVSEEQYEEEQELRSCNEKE